MPRNILSFLIFCFFFAPFEGFAFQSVQKLKEANRLYNLASPTEEDDQRAIAIYQEVLQYAPEVEDAEEYVLASERLGNLLLVYGNTEEGSSAYRKAIQIARAYRLPDSLIYNSHLYLGESLFSLSKLDSSIYHLNQAERIQSSLTGATQEERLFNALGVYYFETGNYYRSIAYFSRAESYLSDAGDEYERYARYSFLSNKASALYHLEQYDSARRIYEKLLDWDINTDQVNLNLANTFLKEENSQNALSVLDRVDSEEVRSSLSYLNLLTKAYLQNDNQQLAHQNLKRTSDVLDSLGLRRKNYQKGVYYGLLGQYHEQKGDLNRALKSYHQGIIELHPTFTNSDLFSNPENFELGMSSISLFEMQAFKAKAAWKLYAESGDLQWYSLGKETYQSAFELANYIGQKFDNDEARVFLGDQVLSAYREGIAFLFSYSDLAVGRIQLAFEWAEQSKANALRINKNRQVQRAEAAIPLAMREEENNLLYAISRVYEELFSSENPERQEELEDKYNELQVSLSRLREKQNDFLVETNLETSQNFNSILEGIPDDLTILSFFEGKSKLYLFKFYQGVLEGKQVDFDYLDLKKLSQWRVEMQKLPAGVRYQTPEYLISFSSLLFKDWTDILRKDARLMIIPHGRFGGLPFEAFPYQEGFLIEEHPVIYQLSAFQIVPSENLKFKLDEVVGFAPFSVDEPAYSSELDMLYGSAEELSQFSGKQYLGREATIARFMEQGQNARFLHLATHAKAFPDDPDASFIAFYPENQNFRLFSKELSFQQFDNLELVYLSACETGGGQLSESEGAISLARSFMLAGSKQVVTTLWLTEDRVASYLSQKFYKRLASGQTASQALQTAKLELLSDPEMAQFRHPAFWSNTILIGQVEKERRSNRWFWGLGIVISLIVIFYLGRRKKEYSLSN